MTAYCKDETIYAEIEKAISNIRDLDLTQFDQNLRNQQLTDRPAIQLVLIRFSSTANLS